MGENLMPRGKGSVEESTRGEAEEEEEEEAAPKMISQIEATAKPPTKYASLHPNKESQGKLTINLTLRRSDEHFFGADVMVRPRVPSGGDKIPFEYDHTLL